MSHEYSTESPSNVEGLVGLVLLDATDGGLPQSTEEAVMMYSIIKGKYTTLKKKMILICFKVIK